MSEPIQAIHVYCDESCHLEHDQASAMVLGAVWCPATHRAMLARKVKAIKKAYGLPPGIEIKWVKVSPAKLDFYRALLDLFFDEAMLHFRALVVPEKQLLNHGRLSQSHDEFYYKMWYLLLNPMLNPDHRYRIFLDIKDTQGQAKITKLHDVLCNANHDFDRELIQSIELVHSHDVLLLQLADLLIGAIAYAHRGLQDSPAKQALVAHIRERSGLSLARSSLLRADKFNLFVWRPQS
jgi:hypothetical protein